ncbi:MAG: Gfo/Idh/MocA family protein [Candidatus Hydrogenedentales bacterium]|jgi:D-galacturonate reductase
MANVKAFDVTIVGGGMITCDLLLPSIYHLQRLGMVGEIHICALNNTPLHALKENPQFAQAFPGQDFIAHPSLDEAADASFPERYKEVLAAMEPYNAVVVATPDQLHYPVVMEALNNKQHVLCVKPLVLKYAQAVEIEELARQKGLFVGVEYHKRFDRRALIARGRYEQGHFGDFVMGEAKLIEPYLYRHSNFQNWFTCENTDPFVYIGCHYVDLTYFITGLKPAGVSVHGVKGTFPNGNTGYLWSQGRVVFENDAVLSVINGLGYPDEGAGSNEQGLVLYCEGPEKTGLIQHDDQFRGVSHSYLSGLGTGGTAFNFVNPDFFQLGSWEGVGYKPMGYGYDSVAAILGSVARLREETAGMPEEDALAKRQEIIDEIDEKRLIATPANSSINELVTEAARMSILSDGDFVKIVYDGFPRIEPKS